MSLGKEIRKTRIDQDISQSTLAQKLGISQQHLSKIEHDKINPRWDTVQRIAQELGIPLVQLIANIPEQGKEPHG